MKSTTLFKLAVAALAALVTACTTNPTSAPEPSSPSPPVAASRPVAADRAPSVLIQGRSNKAILDDIVQWRTQQKKMTVRSRSSDRVELALSVQRTSTPTEARISYVISKEGDGVRLSARVFQFSYPGTTRETGLDVTQSMADKLQEELERYRKPASSW
ncbi:hypothetical protein [Chitinilyticum piscinae]|uniref:Lipoprotein n=1 Tax=Chitinilyticum piscinae TaxID=2866724 RepID=A0A8J7K919_9NEIS|nr:hypothetical protein [Chitinilyticum piscinae]MBE9610543.1 hypothetical protein [Chitinilyticum piscinae]